MRRARRHGRHLVVLKVNVALPRAVSWGIADVSSWIVSEATIIDGDMEDVGEHAERARRFAHHGP